MEWLRRAWGIVVDVWAYELIQFEGESLSAGRLISATALIVLGVLFARRTASFVGKYILPRFHLGMGAIAALQSLFFYAMLAFCTLFALRLASVPLTIFAVLGGALALGIGFGSQAIVNNFISGIILLIEQPVRQGDLIEVDNTFGTVEHIGTRSTLIRTPDNTQIVVPNGAFIERSVINWTLSDNKIRTGVSVGVAYGSDVKQVAELMVSAAASHAEILKSPEPLCLFLEFGDNALQFLVVFWLRLGTMTDRRRVQSDVRFAIDEIFRRENVVIAFPQRDIHLDSSKPLEVRMVSGA